MKQSVTVKSSHYYMTCQGARINNTLTFHETDSYLISTLCLHETDRPFVSTVGLHETDRPFVNIVGLHETDASLTPT